MVFFRPLGLLTLDRFNIVSTAGSWGAESLEISGYVGDDVTLPSGADPSWTLSGIEWSILSNNTWIATLQDKITNTERFHRYKGRLSLNTTSGHLAVKRDLLLNVRIVY